MNVVGVNESIGACIPLATASRSSFVEVNFGHSSLSLPRDKCVIVYSFFLNSDSPIRWRHLLRRRPSTAQRSRVPRGWLERVLRNKPMLFYVSGEGLRVVEARPLDSLAFPTSMLSALELNLANKHITVFYRGGRYTRHI
jgi:hypothetical protein